MKNNIKILNCLLIATFLHWVFGGYCPQLSPFTSNNFQGSNGESVMRLEPDMLGFTCHGHFEKSDWFSLNFPPNCGLVRKGLIPISCCGFPSETLNLVYIFIKWSHLRYRKAFFDCEFNKLQRFPVIALSSHICAFCTLRCQEARWEGGLGRGQWGNH